MALTLLWLSAPGQAQQPSAAHPAMDEQAMAVLKRMTAFLAQAPRFSVTVDTGFDVVRTPGRKSSSAKRARWSSAARTVSASM